MSSSDPGFPLATLETDPLAEHRAALGGSAADPSTGPAPVRRVYAAVRLVMDDAYRDVPHSIACPGPPAEIAAHVDWDTTMAQRRRLDGLGLGIAEAMDTAQRSSLGWVLGEELIRRTGELGLVNGFVGGAGFDHLDGPCSRTAMIDGVVHQARVIRAAGGIPMLLSMVPLARERASEAEYLETYGAIINQLEGPLLIHWLGEAFLPELAGYFPGTSFQGVMSLDPEKVRGAKLSLLDAPRERELRSELLLAGQVMLTGDDLNFADLILGDDQQVRQTTELDGHPLPLGDFSHALLGVLDGVAEPAALALRALALGDHDRYRAIMEPCEAFGRWVFGAPTPRYKSGLAFIAWLGGLQENFMLANHEELGRDRDHYLRAAGLAAAAGAIADRAIARERLSEYLSS